MDQENILTTEGCEWLHRWIIPAVLPGIRVHLVVDSPDAQPREGCVNVFLSIEPPVICPEVHLLLRNSQWCSKWDFIGCADPSVVALQDRARKYVHTPFWVERPLSFLVTKQLGISTIMSSKTWTEGHRLRHWIRENWPSSIPGTIFYGSEPVTPTDALRQPYPADRRDCFTRMFHLVIENCRSNGYFTEKLMDCLRCQSVPIYWGDPEIGEVFDTKGMILIGDLSPVEILDVMQGLRTDEYTKRLQILVENGRRAEDMCEGDNPHPLNPEQNQGKCYRLAKLLREAQERSVS